MNNDAITKIAQEAAKQVCEWERKSYGAIKHGFPSFDKEEQEVSSIIESACKKAVHIAEESGSLMCDNCGSYLKYQTKGELEKAMRHPGVQLEVEQMFSSDAGQASEHEAKQLAVTFHNIYERLAPDFGYETRKETQDFDATTPNGRLMVAVCLEILRYHLPHRPTPSDYQDVVKLIKRLLDTSKDVGQGKFPTEAHLFARRDAVKFLSQLPTPAHVNKDVTRLIEVCETLLETSADMATEHSTESHLFARRDAVALIRAIKEAEDVTPDDTKRLDWLVNNLDKIRCHGDWFLKGRRIFQNVSRVHRHGDEK